MRNITSPAEPPQFACCDGRHRADGINRGAVSVYSHRAQPRSHQTRGPDQPDRTRIEIGPPSTIDA